MKRENLKICKTYQTCIALPNMLTTNGSLHFISLTVISMKFHLGVWQIILSKH